MKDHCRHDWNLINSDIQTVVESSATVIRPKHYSHEWSDHSDHSVHSVHSVITTVSFPQYHLATVLALTSTDVHHCIRTRRRFPVAYIKLAASMLVYEVIFELLEGALCFSQ
jgi:hypothetical protein